MPVKKNVYKSKKGGQIIEKNKQSFIKNLNEMVTKTMKNPLIQEPVQEPVQQKVQQIDQQKQGTNITYIIKGVPGSNYIVFNLKENEKIISSPGSLIYIKGDIDKGEINIGSVMKAFARAFGGEDFLINSYIGLKNGGQVAFSTDIPGDIVKIDLNKDEEYTISRSSFLCGTENLEISSRIVLKGIFGIGTDEGFILPTIKAVDNKASFWLANYGSFEKIILKQGEKIIIDNGVFLAASSTMNYDIVQIGKTMMSSLLGGEGLGMEFTGPGEIYIQSKNLNDLFQLMSLYGRSETTKNEISGNLIKGAFNIFNSEGGKKKRKYVKKNIKNK